MQDSENISPRKQYKLLATQRSRAVLVRRSTEQEGQGVFHDEHQQTKKEGTAGGKSAKGG